MLQLTIGDKITKQNQFVEASIVEFLGKVYISDDETYIAKDPADVCISKYSHASNSKDVDYKHKSQLQAESHNKIFCLPRFLRLEMFQSHLFIKIFEY